MWFGRCADGSSWSLEEIARDEQLVGMKEPLDTLAVGVKRGPDFSPMVGVAEQLIDCFLNRIFDARTFEFGDHDGDPFHKQHSFRDNVASTTGQLDRELVDDEEVIVSWVLEIDKPHRLLPAKIPIGEAVGNCALQEQFGCRLIGVHESMPCRLLEVADRTGNAGIVQPWVPVPQIELLKGGGEPVLQQNLSGALALGRLRQVRSPRSTASRYAVAADRKASRRGQIPIGFCSSEGDSSDGTACDHGAITG